MRISLHGIRQFLLLTAIMHLAGGRPAQAAEDLFPDIIVRSSDLYDYDIVTSNQSGQTLLRLSNGTANIGDGPLYLFGIFPPNGDGTQDVMQRIFRDDGSSYTRLSGKFIHHPTHQHIHFENWASYRIRAVLPNDEIGDILAEGAKTSFCILDLAVYDAGLPHFAPFPQFDQCNSSVQGTSVGWVDVYTKDLPGQSIDVTDLPDGEYWLESEVDPLNNVLELEETNNIARIKVVIGQPAPINPDPYEPNNSAADVLARPAGGVNSPALGPCDPQKVISTLNMHQPGEDDWFSFYLPETGEASDRIRIDFQHTLGDLDLRLLNNSLTQIENSDGVSDFEEISLENVDPGWYYIRVVGFQSATNPSYTLTVNPSVNNPPSVTVVNPPTGDILLQHGIDGYVTSWTSSDPENNQRWVTAYLDTIPVLDGDEFLLPSTLNTPAVDGQTLINSAYFGPGTYWVYLSITDGGSTTGAWSSGSLTFVEALPCPRGDADATGQINIADATFLILYIFGQGPAPVGLENGDCDASGEVSIGDVTYLIAYIFLNGPAPSCP